MLFSWAIRMPIRKGMQLEKLKGPRLPKTASRRHSSAWLLDARGGLALLGASAHAKEHGQVEVLDAEAR
jgi:hypothetical protein